MDISLIEFIVFGLVGYTGVILLIISAFNNTPVTKSQSLMRSMYMILSVISVFILAGTGLNVTTENTVITNQYEVLDNTNAVVVLNSTQTTQNFYTHSIDSPWIAFHGLLGIMMGFYAFTQLLMLLVSKD